MTKVETRTDAAFKMTIPELEGVDELSARVFRAFLARHAAAPPAHDRGAGRQRHPPRPGVLPAVAGRQRRRRPARPRRHAAPGAAHRHQDAPGDGEGRRRRAPARRADQRLTRVYLTAAGRRLEKEMRAVSAAHINETIATLPEADRRELARLLEALSASITAAIEARQRRAHDPPDPGAPDALLAPDPAGARPAVRAGDHQPLPADPQRRPHQQRHRQGRHALHRGHGRLHAGRHPGAGDRHHHRRLLGLQDGHGLRPRRARPPVSQGRELLAGRAQPLRHALADHAHRRTTSSRCRWSC